jgi:hypothetical protein
MENRFTATAHGIGPADFDGAHSADHAVARLTAGTEFRIHSPTRFGFLCRAFSVEHCVHYIFCIGRFAFSASAFAAPLGDCLSRSAAAVHARAGRQRASVSSPPFI